MGWSGISDALPAVGAPAASVARHVRCELRPPVAVVTLDRDEKRNAVDRSMLAALIDLLHMLDEEDEVGVIVLASRGRDFSAGEDLGGLTFQEAAEAQRFLELALGFFEAVELLGTPLIAAVHGYALGFGSECLAVADAAVAHPSSMFGFAEVRHGSVPAVILARGLGPGRTRRIADLALTGRWFGVGEALELGLVDVIDDDPLRAAVDLGRYLASRSRHGTRALKCAVTGDVRDDYLRAHDFCLGVMLQVRPAGEL